MSTNPAESSASRADGLDAVAFVGLVLLFGGAYMLGVHWHAAMGVGIFCLAVAAAAAVRR